MQVRDDCKLSESPPDIAAESFLSKETRADAKSPYFDFQTSSFGTGTGRERKIN